MCSIWHVVPCPSALYQALAWNVLVCCNMPPGGRVHMGLSPPPILPPWKVYHWYVFLLWMIILLHCCCFLIFNTHFAAPGLKRYFCLHTKAVNILRLQASKTNLGHQTRQIYELRLLLQHRCSPHHEHDWPAEISVVELDWTGWWRLHNGEKTCLATCHPAQWKDFPHALIQEPCTLRYNNTLV